MIGYLTDSIDSHINAIYFVSHIHSYKSSVDNDLINSLEFPTAYMMSAVLNLADVISNSSNDSVTTPVSLDRDEPMPSTEDNNSTISLGITEKVSVEQTRRNELATVLNERIEKILQENPTKYQPKNNYELEKYYFLSKLTTSKVDTSKNVTNDEIAKMEEAINELQKYEYERLWYEEKVDEKIQELQTYIDKNALSDEIKVGE
uniref:Uncharacterized protein n=1 Tax=Glossina austeni TaxID=7395 RepID=A0A1A9UWR7_GLOAU